MKAHPAARPLAAAIEATQCAVTLVAILGVLGLVACLAGLAALADLPWMLGGVFMGSFAMAVAKIARRT
ncbi:MAG TPA: hypothetical protein VF481_13580 [Novosphingobium sp.]